MQRELILEKFSAIDGRSIYFEQYEENELIKEVNIRTFVKEHEGFKYIVMVNSCGKTIFEVYQYLNEQLSYDKWKTREKAMYSLKLLFSFIELFNIKNYKKLTSTDLNQFKAFLVGGIQKGNLIELNCKTIRQSTTINQYMTVYRDFYSFLGIKDSVFHDTKPLTDNFIASATSSGYTIQTRKFKSNESQSFKKTVPKYIKFDKYLNILALLENENNNYGLREKIIIKLMFEHGLRLSEVLGLTLEDIKPLNDRYGKIILRNRVSDKQYHECKNLKVPKHPVEYNSYEYQKEKIGFYSVTVSNDIIDLINEYIDDTRNVFSMTPIAKKNIQLSKADMVEKSSVRENYYIFLNKNYTPLSYSGWNKIIRKIYETIGIKVDKGVRKDNLSHRLRHGFAMVCIQNGVDRFTLKELMRHKCLSSVEIYYNPTPEDEIEMSIDVIQIFQRKMGINIEQQIINMN